jgi:hypothetical protein
MDTHARSSRRSLLMQTALLAAAAMTAGIVPSRQASAQQKASKEAMKYQDKPNGDERCSNCMQFVPPASCKVVGGVINPNGYCIAWVKKA